MARGVKGSSTTPEHAKHAAKARAYYAKNKGIEFSRRTNAWNRTHRDAGRERSRAWPKKNPARARTLRNAWTAANRERSRTSQKAWHAKHPGYNAAKSNACYRGQQEALAGSKRPKRCQVCHKAGKICFDHDHVDNHFRGWTCLNCNLILGLAKDKPHILRKLAVYLAAPPACIKLPYWPLKPKKKLELLGKTPKRCQICKGSGRICIDHCHKKMVFRGWLCIRCNSALGHAHDSPKILRKLADYLDNDKAKQKGLKKNGKAKK